MRANWGNFGHSRQMKEAMTFKAQVKGERARPGARTQAASSCHDDTDVSAETSRPRDRRNDAAVAPICF